jgi:N-acetylglutamate synthase-like GNAT family acetyltransferase
MIQESHLLKISDLLVNHIDTIYPKTNVEKQAFIKKLDLSRKSICKRHINYVDLVKNNIDEYEIMYVEENDNLIGFCAFNTNAKTLLLHYICSSRPGYGKYMISLLKEICEYLNLQEIKLDSTPENVAFYKKFGFTLVDEDSVWENPKYNNASAGGKSKRRITRIKRRTNKTSRYNKKRLRVLAHIFDTS